MLELKIDETKNVSGAQGSAPHPPSGQAERSPAQTPTSHKDKDDGNKEAGHGGTTSGKNDKRVRPQDVVDAKD